MTATVFDRLHERLRQAGIAHEIRHHEPVFTSEEAARVRGTSLASGAKALICKCDDAFVMFVMPADKRLAGKKVKGALRIRSLRFASADEVLERTGLKPGSIPPFGSLFGLRTYCDQGLLSQPQINFNAGDHSISVSMACDDYQKVEAPELGDFVE